MVAHVRRPVAIHQKGPIGHDTLGGLQLETSTYVYMTKRAKTLANGRIVSALEGGYNLDALGECAVAHFRAFQEDRA